MKWMAIACSAENEILACAESLPLLESACLNDFRAISRIYGVEDQEAQELKNGNLAFRIEFNGPRNTKLVPHSKNNELEVLSEVLQGRVKLMQELHQRLAHGFKRFESVIPWQHESYEEKYQEALAVLNGNSSDVAMVQDYADESGLTINVAAGLIVNKYQNRKFLIRKLERLRIRHQAAIRNIQSKQDYDRCRSAIEEDSFLSMMM
jgi:hypothetical protein